MREIRLWVGQIVVPALITVGAVMQIPGVKEDMDEKIQQTKRIDCTEISERVSIMGLFSFWFSKGDY